MGTVALKSVFLNLFHTNFAFRWESVPLHFSLLFFFMDGNCFWQSHYTYNSSVFFICICFYPPVCSAQNSRFWTDSTEAIKPLYICFCRFLSASLTLLSVTRSTATTPYLMTALNQSITLHQLRTSGQKKRLELKFLFLGLISGFLKSAHGELKRIFYFYLKLDKMSLKFRKNWSFLLFE